MASAVANPQYMGYKAMYRTVLEDSRRGIAKALRVFVDADSFPVLIHCIHGVRTCMQPTTPAAGAYSTAWGCSGDCLGRQVFRKISNAELINVMPWECSALHRSA